MDETFKVINISLNNEKIILIVTFLQLRKTPSTGRISYTQYSRENCFIIFGYWIVNAVSDIYINKFIYIGEFRNVERKKIHIVCTAYTVQPVLFIKYRLGNVYANPKKDTVMFGSPHYIVKTSYR